MRISFVLLLACAFCSTNIRASEKAESDIVQQQKIQITGTVIDETGLPIIGANVLEIGTTNGTITDYDGNFSLSVTNNAVIRITYIGYNDQDINTAGKRTFNVTMVEDRKALDE